MKNDNRDRDFIKKCRNIDFSVESVNKEKNLEILINKLKNNENEKEIIMNKKIRKPTVLIAAAAALICLSMAAYGQDLVKIIKTVTLGNHAEYLVVEDKREFIPIPEELKGLVFDKDGNELEVFPEERILYNKDGQEIMPIYDSSDGKARIMTKEEFASVQSKSVFPIYDQQEGKSYFICDTLSPGYLPEGYKFDRIEYYIDPESEEDIKQGTQKYMSVYYSNDKYEMYSQFRYMDEETAFGSSATENIRKTKINGYDTVIDGNMLSIQIGDVMYTFFATEDLSIDELVKMAESLE